MFDIFLCKDHGWGEWRTLKSAFLIIRKPRTEFDYFILGFFEEQYKDTGYGFTYFYEIYNQLI